MKEIKIVFTNYYHKKYKGYSNQFWQAVDMLILAGKRLGEMGSFPKKLPLYDDYKRVIVWIYFKE